MFKKFILPLFAILFMTAPMSKLQAAESAAKTTAKIETREISYEVAGQKFKGFLAKPATASKKLPGVLIVHEWWGHNDYARRRAKMMAELGYVAFALDMFGENNHTEHAKDAKGFADQAQKSGQIPARFEKAFEILKSEPEVDKTKIAAIGYCFGGGVVLNMARSGSALKGVVSFHGGLSTKTPAQKGKVLAKVLVLNGDSDLFVSAAEIEAFKKEMDTAKVDYKFVGYPNALHGFTDKEDTERGKKNNLPIAYNAEADQKSWQEMQDFFKKIF